jgi:superfamily I DNA and/or RNA helicase
MEGGLNRSLFESLQDMGVPSIMLNTQYRMHPGIAAFPSQQFYQGELRNADVVDTLHPPDGFDWPLAEEGGRLPVAFVPTTGFDEQVTLDGTSKSNPEEAKAVMQTLRDLLDAGELEPDHIGIVTPYRGQKELIQKLIASEEQFDGVEVNTVDGYQGREKEMIVFSSVRANEDGKVGFLADWRRLNVALTRAKRGVVVFGCVTTLRNDSVWNAWIEHVVATGGYRADEIAIPSAADSDVDELIAAELVAGAEDSSEATGKLASNQA